MSADSPWKWLTRMEVIMHRVLTRSIVLGSLAATMLAGTALGHECIVISRSDTGNVAAGAHSARWETVATIESLFTDPFLVPVPLEGAQLDWAVEAAREAGLPETLTIFVGAKTIADGTPAMERHSRDGKGIDHAFDWFPTIIAIYEQALEQ
jgi:hypothetical protein